MMTNAAVLFRENYGKWGAQSPKQGQPVALSASRLRAQYLPSSADTVYAMVTVDGDLAGNAFACRWNSGETRVCWITQLVVSKEHRQGGLAEGLLNCLRQQSDDVYGIMSSHPAACLAAAKAFFEKISLDLIQQHAREIISTESGLVSGVNTRFFVDHVEPLEALEEVKAKWHWPLGELEEGHEFLMILQARLRCSSRRPKKT
ncbi:unnamed protein product [Penicillium salamii]|uniref:N-acetyltransferase domain-containing protein n=1 Tax=Penicillium salamii TaxID=1612424 RepID=A0A9W4JUZ6_9EURO|nr:unnamed protein product [Penicillium salamii]